ELLGGLMMQLELRMLAARELDHGVADVDTDAERRLERGERIGIAAPDFENPPVRRHDEAQQLLQRVVVVAAALDPAFAARAELIVERFGAPRLGEQYVLVRRPGSRGVVDGQAGMGAAERTDARTSSSTIRSSPYVSRQPG